MVGHKRRGSGYPYWAWPLRLFGDWWDSLSASDRVFWLVMTALVFAAGWIWADALK